MYVRSYSENIDATDYTKSINKLEQNRYNELPDCSPRSGFISTSCPLRTHTTLSGQCSKKSNKSFPPLRGDRETPPPLSQK